MTRASGLMATYGSTVSRVTEPTGGHSHAGTPKATSGSPPGSKIEPGDLPLTPPQHAGAVLGHRRDNLAPAAHRL